jgi:hypothetical protein
MIPKRDDWTACRAGGLVWGFRLEPRPPILDEAQKQAWQRGVIRDMVRARHLIVVHEGTMSSCPQLIAWCREEHAALHPDWPPLKVLLSVNCWGVWDRDRAQYEYWPFQMKIREACTHNGWFLVVNGDVARFSADWGDMVLFDVRRRDFRQYFSEAALETFKPWTASVDGSRPPNGPDYLYFDEINRTDTEIGQTGKHLPPGWSEGVTILARDLRGGMFNGSLQDTPMLRGRMIQNAQWLTVDQIAEWIQPAYRPRMDYLLDFMGDPRDAATCERAAAVAALFDAHWGVHEGAFGDPVYVNWKKLTEGSLGLPAEYLVDHPWIPPAQTGGSRLFADGYVSLAGMHLPAGRVRGEVILKIWQED